MISQNVDRVLEAVKTLTPEEQRQVRDLIAKLPETAASAQGPDQILLARGVLRSIPVGKDPARFGAWRAVEIDGKPLSQTIIEERR